MFDRIVRMTPLRGFLWLSVLVLAVISAGCGDAPRDTLAGPEEPIVWPEPPDPPRIRYAGSLSTQADIEKKSSFGQGVGELIFGKAPIGVLVTPYALALDSDDRLFVTDPGASVVHVFDLKKRSYKQFSKLDNGRVLLKPVGIALVEDRIYIVDSALHTVCVFDRKGDFRFEFGQGLFERPSGIAYHPATEHLYITDTAAHTVHLFSRDGTLVRTIGQRGLQRGSFNYPTHLCVDAKGNLYVSDTLNYRVQMFDDRGNATGAFGKQGDRPGNFAHPCGLTVDQHGYIFVTDRQFENVQIFDRTGRILMAFGEEGSKPGQFWLPAGLCVDGRNRLYVADSYNKRIQIFELLEESENENANN